METFPLWISKWWNTDAVIYCCLWEAFSSWTSLWGCILCSSTMPSLASSSCFASILNANFAFLVDSWGLSFVLDCICSLIDGISSMEVTLDRLFGSCADGFPSLGRQLEISFVPFIGLFPDRDVWIVGALMMSILIRLDLLFLGFFCSTPSSSPFPQFEAPSHFWCPFVGHWFAGISIVEWNDCILEHHLALPSLVLPVCSLRRRGHHLGCSEPSYWLDCFVSWTC